jgi:Mrp family chromosome partitioning ATPase
MQAVRPPQLSPAADSAAGDGGVSIATEPDNAGSVSVLLSGGPVGNPPALLASDATGPLLRSIADDFDYVLIDAPPPLEVSDVMPLLHLADGIITVVRIGHTHDNSSQRLVQLLRHTASAPVLGAVANCVPRKDIERYGFSWAPTERRRKLIRR